MAFTVEVNGKTFIVNTNVTHEGKEYRYEFNGLSCNRLDWIAERIADQVHDDILKKLVLAEADEVQA
jgi:hypothetical protein